MTTGPLDLDFSDLSVLEINPDDTATVNGAPMTAAPYYGPPGTRGICPNCGRELTILQSGRFKQHKCKDGQLSEAAPTGGTGPGRPPAPQPKKGRAPEKVQVLWVAATASGTEWTAREVIARNTGAPKAIIPVDMGDRADDMLRPVLDAVWPRLPKGAQKAITAIADEGALVLAAIMWGQYVKALNQWQDEYKRTALHAPARPAPTQAGASHGIPGQNEAGGGYPLPAFQPFVPDATAHG